MVEASCLCGAVRWQLEGPFEWMAHCHCSRCRKAHGSAFATYVASPAAGFRLSGGEHVACYRAEGGIPRCFCRRCGSVVPSDATGASVYSPAGNLLADPEVRPQSHMFAGSKAPWFEIADDLPRFEAFPPGLDTIGLPDREPLDPPGHPRGSCLCGAVAFVLEGPPQIARHCHCNRCRRARSAAHASNLITQDGALRFTRGADQLGDFKVPDARYFRQVFCTRCGSPMPRVDPSRSIAVVPMGSLDDDPGLSPTVHIFVGSKAP
ncbi:MAG TPA: GFA family protein, partial [Polyangiaceae bacterium]|nr:GFA family protein [Polyangiaceae bacterium]